MAAAIRTCYISSSCNRTPHSVDWGENGILCYGTCNSVALVNPENETNNGSYVMATLNRHKGRVNCVRWVRGRGSEYELVSGSVDKSVIVWGRREETYHLVAVLTGHAASVNAVDSIYVTKPAALTNQRGDGTPCASGSSNQHLDTIIASTSADSTVKIWRRRPGHDFMEQQSISFGTGFAMDVSLCLVPGTEIPVLACGGDDQKIQVYVEEDNKFVKVISLHGHEDWIRGLEFARDDSGDLLLASCSQDQMIRIWRFSRRKSDDKQISIKDLPRDQEIRMRENTFRFKHNGQDQVFAATLESVLSGHENWIYSVRWQPAVKTDTVSGYHQPMALLSASMDKTMFLWQPDPSTGVWLDQVRVGEVGGNTLGLYGGIFSPCGNCILAHGYQGAFHQWNFDKAKGIWENVVTTSGHFDAVEDLQWDTGGGQFIISIGIDQATRLHAPWVRSGKQTHWYEVARPQVHGYDLQCMTMIHRYRFASGADEKVIRVFDAPKNFIENFCSICDQNLEKALQSKEAISLPEGASVPALGLSNKAVFQEEAALSTTNSDASSHRNEQYPEVYFKPVSLKCPPSEEHLLQNTLWPESQKLYGHGYEVFSIACDPAGEVLASACKASKAEHAGIILWDTTTWKQIETLEGATLTVTQLSFSHDGCYLLSVSRDRTWSLYKRNKPCDAATVSDPLFVRISSIEKKTSPHSRIIWSCAWSHDDKYFITTSRDKKALLWHRSEIENGDASRPVRPVSALELQDSVTAVDMAPACLSENRYLCAFGLDSGSICIYSYSNTKEAGAWTLCAALDQTLAHHMTVKRLRFRPHLGEAGMNYSDTEEQRSCIQLASCGADHGVRIFTIQIKGL